MHETAIRIARALAWRLRRVRHRLGTVVGPGSRSDRVAAVQRLVNDLTGAGLSVDGVYGGKTRNGVRRLQRDLGLPPTSWADPITVRTAVRERSRAARRQSATVLARTRFDEDLRVVELHLPAGHLDPSTDPRTLIVAAPRSAYIPQVLDRDGLAGYEPDTLAAWLAALETLPPGPVLDIGANVGVFSMVASAAHPDRDVTAFEPTPDLAEMARVVAEANDLRFVVEQLALGDSDGAATLYLSQSSDSSNSLAEGFRHATGAIEVPLERLDSWCERRRRAPVLMKVDTETTEPAVLRGGLETIARVRPWIVCEVLRDVGAEVAQLLGPLGYRWHRIDDQPRFPEREHLETDTTFHYLNWLLTPTPVPDAFWGALGRWRTALDATRTISPG